MRFDRDNRYLVSLRPIIPKNSISGRRGLFRISFKNFLLARAMKTCKFTRLKTGMSGIAGQILNGLANRFITFVQTAITTKVI